MKKSVNSNDDSMFYNTIGKVDSVIIKMVSELLGISYNNVNIYRNGNKYISCFLVLVFDNNLFVDVRVNCNNINKKDIIEGFYSFIDIYDNTYEIDLNNYKYIMLDLIGSNDSLLCNSIDISSSYGDLFKDSFFRVIYYNYVVGYKVFNSNINIIDNRIRWLSAMNAISFKELDYIFTKDMITYDEKMELYGYIRDVSK